MKPRLPHLGRLSRREFMGAASLAASGLAIPQGLWAGTPKKAKDDLQVAIIGPGSQGRFLLMAGLKIPGIRFRAVCDIWPYHQRYAGNILKKYGQPSNVYEDYREMLAKEKGLDAVLIATPDFMHAEQTVACLEAGLHVYCEKEMSNTLDGCRLMVKAAKKSGKKLQIGHQRRSNPRYLHSLNLIRKDGVLGRPTQVYGQWNRAQRLDRGWPKKEKMDKDALKRYGYGSMERFRNWRWYRDFSGGPMADLGSHQVDVFNWFLGTPPRAVQASGGLDYYKDREWYDTVMCLYEWETKKGVVRGSYQVLNTTSHGGYYELFMGDEGSLNVSEDTKLGYIFQEVKAARREWIDAASKIENASKLVVELRVGETRAPGLEGQKEALKMVEDSEKPIHQPHLENFFDAIRGKAKLNCPAEVGYETAVSVLNVNKAVEEKTRIEFSRGDFKA